MVVLDYPKLPPDEEAGAWLHTIVMNVARSRIRRVKRRLKLMEENDGEVARPARLDGPSLEASLLYKAVTRTISELPSLQRRVLLCRIVDGLSTKETARVVDRSEGTVKSSLSRAVATLKGRFGDQLRTALDSVSSMEATGPPGKPPDRREQAGRGPPENERRGDTENEDGIENSNEGEES